MKKWLLATQNPGKLQEFSQALEHLGIEFISLNAVGFDDSIAETGETFVENALIKARFAAKKYNMPALADDSGLEIDALGGAPGVYSARYAGEHASDDKNIDKVLMALEGVAEEKRGARFVCVLALVLPDGRAHTVRGEARGRITTARVGTDGFGYDPIFFVPALNRTMAQLTFDEKNAISHRGKALAALATLLKDVEID